MRTKAVGSFSPQTEPNPRIWYQTQPQPSGLTSRRKKKKKKVSRLDG